MRGRLGRAATALPAWIRWRGPGAAARSLRVLWQSATLLAFIALLALTLEPFVAGVPLTVWLRLDPLVALSTALATGTLYADLALALCVVLLTLVLGRVFCSWLCPLGALNTLVGRMFRARRSAPAEQARNAWRPAYRSKYLVLAGLLLAAALGVNAAGLLDPIALLWRSLAVGFAPGATVWFPSGAYPMGWLLGLLLLAVLIANVAHPRWFCRALCPLGALLGLLARFSLLRIHRDPERCNGCNLCQAVCAGAAEPQETLLASECVLCLNCTAICPHQAITVRWLPPSEGSRALVDVGRRSALLSLGAGAAAVLAVRSDPRSSRQGAAAKHAVPSLIRPPGALAEPAFVAACVKCGACVKACPTRVLAPTWLEAGLDGLWTPKADFSLGHCDPDCDVCGRVCPTGAIARFTLADRRGSSDGPLRMGTAFHDRGSCLPWAAATPCSKCEEHCPTSPKAIWLELASAPRRDAPPLDLLVPHVDVARCIGCGTCEWVCPVAAPAVRVVAAGETRSPERRLVL
ncbi:MAG: ferredoxin [Myxococcales bacterium]